VRAGQRAGDARRVRRGAGWCAQHGNHVYRRFGPFACRLEIFLTLSGVFRQLGRLRRP